MIRGLFGLINKGLKTIVVTTARTPVGWSGSCPPGMHLDEFSVFLNPKFYFQHSATFDIHGGGIIWKDASISKLYNKLGFWCVMNQITGELWE
jgi:hypothetical protein